MGKKPKKPKTPSLQPGDTGEVAPPTDTSPGDTSLIDPTRKRETDTASLKRVKPGEDAAAAGAGDLEVVKEPKKQFKNAMTSSQTLKRGEDTAAEADTELAPPAATEGAAKRTLKIRAPADAETRTETISRPSRAASTQAAEPTAAPQAAAAATESPKSTLKIKAPPGTAPVQADGTKPGATLKIKAPGATAGETQVETAAPSPAQTVKQEAPKRAGKTLKMRGPAAAASRAARPSRPGAVPPTKAEMEEATSTANLVYIGASAATVILAIIAIAITFNSSSTLFGSLF